MSPRAKKIQSDEQLPPSADVVIIGGGIVGAATAYYLARQGVSVALLEKGYVGCEQSSRNWGWCRQQNRDAREMPLSILSMRLWDDLAKEIGQDLGFRRCGLLYASDDDKQLALWEKWQETAKLFDVETRMLSAREAAEKFPQTKRQWRGGVHAARDGKAEPELAAPVLAEGARALGASIHQHCAAYGLDITNGAVTGVHTEKGYIAANAVLCAAGAWASAFCHEADVRFPQACVRQTALRSRPAPNVGEVLYTPDCALTRRLDGSYTMTISGKATLELTPQSIRYAKPFMPMFIKRLRAVQVGIGKSFFTGPESLSTLFSTPEKRFSTVRVLDPDPNPKFIAAILANVRENFPALVDIDVAESWGAYVDSTPDAVPVISPVDKVSGFYLAAGCSGHGFGLGPGIGFLAAEMIAQKKTSVDPHPFRLSRLSDGTKIEVGAL
ncbi:NAD(P)/FAD-dependent oxidoreductase [Sphingobium sp.]|uniref:NAD(P)/FAD-dependent oxidoreductase n=1 Tax=Sphingobium sp. TaxID=1912891 RepID=UPI003BB64BD9